MKKFVRFIAALGLCGIIAWPTPSFAAPMPSPEGAFLCLAGKLQGGEGGAACTVYTADFFNLWYPNKMACDRGLTKMARANYLLRAPALVDSVWYAPIVEAYGGCAEMPPFEEPDAHGHY